MYVILYIVVSNTFVHNCFQFHAPLLSTGICHCSWSGVPGWLCTAPASVLPMHGSTMILSRCWAASCKTLAHPEVPAYKQEASKYLLITFFFLCIYPFVLFINVLYFTKNSEFTLHINVNSSFLESNGLLVIVFLHIDKLTLCKNYVNNSFPDIDRLLIKNYNDFAEVKSLVIINNITFERAKEYPRKETTTAKPAHKN